MMKRVAGRGLPLNLCKHIMATTKGNILKKKWQPVPPMGSEKKPPVTRDH